LRSVTDRMIHARTIGLHVMHSIKAKLSSVKGEKSQNLFKIQVQSISKNIVNVYNVHVDICMCILLYRDNFVL